MENQQGNFPDFGDIWFTSFMVGSDGDLMGASNIAFTFVAHFIEQDYWSQLFENHQDKNELFARLLPETIPYEMRNSLANPLYQALSPTMVVHQSHEARFKIYTHQWRFADIHPYLDQFDQSIAFVRERIAPEDDHLLLVRFLRNGEQLLSTDFAGETYRDGSISIFINSNVSGAISRLLAHEATHAFVFLGLENAHGQRIPQVLDEGLATFMEYYYIAYFRDELGLFSHTLLRYHTFISGYADAIENRFWERYEEQYGGRNRDTVDHRIMLDVYAYFESINPDFDLGRFSLPHQQHIFLTYAAQYDTPNTYRQSGSFVQFLYHRFDLYTVVALTRDFTRADEIVGYNFDQLASEWRDTLGIY